MTYSSHKDSAMYVGKVMFVGDVHLKAQNPACRKDNYAEAVLTKLRWIKDYCHEKRISNVVFLGDFFDTPTIAWSLFTQVMQILQSLKDFGIRCYAIVGNHDIRYDRLETLNETSLGVLFLAGLLIRLSENPIQLSGDGSKIVGFDYTQKITPYNEEHGDGANVICVAHEYFQCDFSDETLQSEDLYEANYPTYVFGHDHAPYLPMKKEAWTLYRPGSLSRNSSEAHNRMRIPRVLIYDNENMTWNFVDVSVAKQPSDVIMVTAEDTALSMFDLVETLCSSYNENASSVREYVNGMGLSEEIHTIVIQYLDKLGV